MGNRTSKGFTLIELLVVIAIIAILVAILMPVFGAAREKARQARCSANIMQIVTALGQYKTDYGRYPFRPYFDGTQYVGGVSALYPDYIPERSVLVCPNDEANLRGLQNVPKNYSTYNGLAAGIADSSVAAADFWKFAAQNAQDGSGQYPSGAGETTELCCITYNYGGLNNYGWDQSYWDTATNRWAFMTPTGGPVPSWLSTDGKKWRHYPRLGNRRAPDNTVAIWCRAHHRFYGRDEANSNPEPDKWRSVVGRVGGKAESIDYLPWTKAGTTGASEWRIQE